MSQQTNLERVFEIAALRRDIQAAHEAFNYAASDSERDEIASFATNAEKQYLRLLAEQEQERHSLLARESSDAKAGTK